MVQFDGNWIDSSSLVLSVLCGAHRPIRRKLVFGKFDTPPLFCVRDALSGAALMPFVLMMGAVISSDLLRDVLASHAYIGIGGLLGVIALLGEMLREH